MMMPRRQWFLSALLFLISAGFLFYSKSIFTSQDRQTAQSTSLPSVEIEKHNVVLLANKDYYPYLKTYFRKAKTKIIGTVYLFKTAPFRDNEPTDLMRELIAARKREVDVELIIDVSNGDEGSTDKELKDANLNVAQLLMKNGIRVRLDTAQMTTHSKTFVIDDRYCFVGSHNLTHSGLSRNAEVSLFLDSPEMAMKLTDFIRQIPVSNR